MLELELQDAPCDELLRNGEEIAEAAGLAGYVGDLVRPVPANIAVEALFAALLCKSHELAMSRDEALAYFARGYDRYVRAMAAAEEEASTKVELKSVELVMPQHGASH